MHLASGRVVCYFRGQHSKCVKFHTDLATVRKYSVTKTAHAVDVLNAKTAHSRVATCAILCTLKWIQYYIHIYIYTTLHAVLTFLFIIYICS